MVIHVLRALGRRTSTVVRGMVDISNIDRDLYAGMRATSSSCWYSSVSVFDTGVKAAQRSRAAQFPVEPDPLQDEVARRVVERIQDCSRDFKDVLVLGGAGLQVLKSLVEERTGIQRAVLADHSKSMIERNMHAWDAFVKEHPKASAMEVEFHEMDPASPQEDIGTDASSFDVVVSCLGLHWVNDIPGVMIQCKKSLRPDGFFVAALLGGDTLQELRIACTLAQQEREGGVSPRTSPFVRVRDAGNLLTRAGMQIASVDVDDIIVNYPDAVSLVQHLRRMGETNAMVNQRSFLSRDTALAAAAAYTGMFREDESSNHIPATYQVIYMTGWSPDEFQPKPATRGSATFSFHDLTKRKQT